MTLPASVKSSVIADVLEKELNIIDGLRLELQKNGDPQAVRVLIMEERMADIISEIRERSEKRMTDGERRFSRAVGAWELTYISSYHAGCAGIMMDELGDGDRSGEAKQIVGSLKDLMLGIRDNHGSARYGVGAKEAVQ